MLNSNLPFEVYSPDLFKLGYLYDVYLQLASDHGCDSSNLSTDLVNERLLLSIFTFDSPKNSVISEAYHYTFR
jgi:hypothetical protein